MRIFNIIKTELNADKQKLEEELERIINDKSIETSKKVIKIKKILGEMAIIELSFNKFEDLIKVDDSDDENNK